MANRQPENFMEVLLGSLGEGLTGVARQKEFEQQQALPEAISILNATLRMEEAERDREAHRFRVDSAKRNIDMADLKIQKIMRELSKPVMSEEDKNQLEADLAQEKMERSLSVARESAGAAEIGEQFFIPSGVKAVTPPRGPEELGEAAAIQQAAKIGKLEELGLPTALPGAKTLSAKDQWYKSYLDKSFSPEEATRRFADYVNPETGPEEKKEYFRILRSQLGGIFVDPSDPEHVKAAENLAMKTTGWLPEYEGKASDIIAGLRNKLEAGAITQDQYDAEIAHINELLGKVGAGQP